MKNKLLFLLLIISTTANGENNIAGKPPKPVIVDAEFSYVFVNDPNYWFFDEPEMTFVLDVVNTNSLIFSSWYSSDSNVPQVYKSKDLGEMTTGQITIVLPNEGDAYECFAIMAANSFGHSELSDTIYVNDLIDDDYIREFVGISTIRDFRSCSPDWSVSVINGVLRVAGLSVASLELYNTKGSMIRNNSKSDRLEVYDLINGLYILKIKPAGSNCLYSKKIVL